jgi:putative transcriptional regulator
MKDDLFEELLQSVREGGAILRGEAAPADSFTADDPDVAGVREQYGLSQSKFAGMLGISVRTLQNWEQRRRRPEGPARILLRVAARHPEAVLDTVFSERGGNQKSRKVSTQTAASGAVKTKSRRYSKPRKQSTGPGRR